MVRIRELPGFGPAAWKIEPLLEKARRLAAATTPDESVRKLLGDLDEMEQQFAAPAPVLHMLDELFDMFGDD